MKKPVITRIIIILVILVVLFFVIRAMKLVDNSKVSDPDGFLDAFYKWVSDREGSIQDRAIGGDKGKKRSPWTYWHNDRWYVNPFSSRGIDFAVFEKYGPRLGYAVTKENFHPMPDRIFEPLVKILLIDKGLPYTTNLVLAAYIGGWYWGSGSISATNKAKIKAILKSNDTPQNKLEALISLRKAFFLSLHNSDPVKYPMDLVEAWYSRADSFRNNFKMFA